MAVAEPPVPLVAVRVSALSRAPSPPVPPVAEAVTVGMRPLAVMVAVAVAKALPP